MNAIEAIDEKYLNNEQKETIAESPQLVISTSGNIVDDKKSACIHIADNGIGILETIQSKIFNQFFTTKLLGKGKGLGLSIAHQIVTEKHGGHISFESQYGKSTTFTITLPIDIKNLT